MVLNSSLSKVAFITFSHFWPENKKKKTTDRLKAVFRPYVVLARKELCMEVEFVQILCRRTFLLLLLLPYFPFGWRGLLHTSFL